jgi:cytochrome c-type biogenesis protein CcmE
MTLRQQRMVMVAAIVLGVSIAAWLGMRAFDEYADYFINPSQIAAGQAPQGKRFRLGGMVAKGSVMKTAGTLDLEFQVTDFSHTVPVKFHGIPPDLFREGQGVVAIGRMQGATFVADEILAKHDENYMPPEVAEALKNNPPPPDAKAPPAGTGT